MSSPGDGLFRAWPSPPVSSGRWGTLRPNLCVILGMGSIGPVSGRVLGMCRWVHVGSPRCTNLELKIVWGKGRPRLIYARYAWIPLIFLIFGHLWPCKFLLVLDTIWLFKLTSCVCSSPFGFHTMHVLHEFLFFLSTSCACCFIKRKVNLQRKGEIQHTTSQHFEPIPKRCTSLLDFESMCLI